MAELHHVFAYGSNMHLPDLARWLREKQYPPLRPRGLCTGHLLEHELAWNYRSVARQGGAANVRPRAGARVPGLVLTVEEELLLALDAKEGSSYERVRLAIAEADGITEAWVYRVLEERLVPGGCPPRREYLDIVIRAAEEHGLPEWHLEALRTTTTAD